MDLLNVVFLLSLSRRSGNETQIFWEWYVCGGLGECVAWSYVKHIFILSFYFKPRIISSLHDLRWTFFDIHTDHNCKNFKPLKIWKRWQLQLCPIQNNSHWFNIRRHVIDLYCVARLNDSWLNTIRYGVIITLFV